MLTWSYNFDTDNSVNCDLGIPYHIEEANIYASIFLYHLRIRKKYNYILGFGFFQTQCIAILLTTKIFAVHHKTFDSDGRTSIVGREPVKEQVRSANTNKRKIPFLAGDRVHSII